MTLSPDERQRIEAIRELQGSLKRRGPMPDKIRLNSVLGKERGVDETSMSMLRSLMVAYLRLGTPFTVRVDRYGKATVEECQP